MNKLSIWELQMNEKLVLEGKQQQKISGGETIRNLSGDEGLMGIE